MPLFLISFCGRDRGNGAVFRSQRLYGKISINRRAEHISGAEPLAPLCQLPRRKFQTAEAAGQRDRCSVKGQLRLPAVPVDFRFLCTSKVGRAALQVSGPQAAVPSAEPILSFAIRRSVFVFPYYYILSGTNKQEL